jgi:hypothetical protein
MIIVLAKMAFDKGIPLVQILLLLCFLLSISSFGFDTLAISTGAILLAIVAMLPPLLGVSVVLIEDLKTEPAGT